MNRKGQPGTRAATPKSMAAIYLGLILAVYLLWLLAPLHAGGPLKVAGITGFNPGLAGTPLTWPGGALQYYTDQGDLSPVLPQAEANSFVADAFLRWTSVPTAALSATRAGQLDEDVNGSNVVFIDFGNINMPADIQPSALAKPLAIVYDADGKVTDALLGQGAGAPDMCSTNAAYGGPDNYTADAHLGHALVVLNGNCAQSSAALPDLKYHLIRVLGRVLGLDWADLNSNVFTRKPYPIADDYLGFPVMHALDPPCPGLSVCFPAAEQLKMDDRAAISRLYPVTSANIGNFAGKQIFREATARVRGTVYFRGRDGSAGQPMQGVKVVARWLDPATGLPSHRYAVTSVSGFLFRGNAGNPATGFADVSGQRYDKFGANDPALEGYFDLAGLEFPDNGATAQYQIAFESVDPLCGEPNSVGPYRTDQVTTSGTADSITVTVSKGSDLTRDIVMSSSALPLAVPGGTFAAPARLPLSTSWTGSLSPYGRVAYFSFAARGDRSMTVRITALDESGRVTQSKAQPVIGIWPAAAAADSPPDVSASYFNSLDPGTTVLNAQFLTGGNFKLGIADFRGDGRPDFRYRARIFYADAVTPTRVAAQSGSALTIGGIGLETTTGARIGSSDARLLATLPGGIVLSAPRLPDGAYDIELRAGDGSTTTLLRALSYGAVPGDQIQLLQGATNPSTPVGGQAPYALRVRVVEADGITPVPGATVNFSASPGSVIFTACGTTACSLITDEQGEASSRMLPGAAATFTITAAISPSAYVHAGLTAVSSGLDIAAVSPWVWAAEGATFSLPLTVRVLSGGAPLSGRSVQYRVTQGSASLGPAVAPSDAAGYATANLNLSSLAAEVHASACVLPDAKPCVNFYLYVVPAASLRLQYVAGDQQVINTAQAFSAVRMRVTDSSSPPNPVLMAPVAVLTGIFRWQPPPVSAGPSPPPPSAPVVLSSGLATVYSDAAGMISLTPSPDARFGAVVVKVIAFPGAGPPLQFELQRLWAPPGWSAGSTAQSNAATKQPARAQAPTFSSRYLPTD